MISMKYAAWIVVISGATFFGLQKYMASKA